MSNNPAHLKYDPDKAREGDRAFSRLYERSDNDKELCNKWNEFCASAENKEKRDEYLKDETFMSYYLRALYADSVPSKRKRITEFFEYMSQGQKAISDADLDIFD